MDPEPAWTDRMNPPENEVPVALAWTAVVARSADIAVAVVGARAYGNGIALDLAVRARARPDHVHGLFEAVDGYGTDRLLLGLEYADGRTTSGPPGPPLDDLPEDAPLLHHGGGYGGDLSVDQTYFLSPLPPAGPVAFYCAWPSMGVAETRTEFDGSGLAEAVRRVEVLWPPADPRPPGPPRPGPPDLPDGSWFARNLR